MEPESEEFKLQTLEDKIEQPLVQEPPSASSTSTVALPGSVMSANTDNGERGSSSDNKKFWKEIRFSSTISEMPKPDKTKKDVSKTEVSKTGSDSEDDLHYTLKISHHSNYTDSEDDLHYTPKISHHSNYTRFLQLFHGRTGSLSEDEAGNQSGNEGFIEDEMVQDMTIVEEDLCPDLSPADYENSAHIEQGQELVASPDNVSEEQKKEWRDELEKLLTPALPLSPSSDQGPAPFPAQAALETGQKDDHEKKSKEDSGIASDYKSLKPPLWSACHDGDLARVQSLVISGEDPDSKDKRGVSCLMAAFRNGHIEVVNYLVEHVKQLPPDADLSKCISRVSDKELKWHCQQCMEIIVTAKRSLAAKAEKNENKKAAAAKKREKKKKKKVKQVKEKEEPRSDEYCPSDKPGVKESETLPTPGGLGPLSATFDQAVPSETSQEDDHEQKSEEDSGIVSLKETLKNSRLKPVKPLIWSACDAGFLKEVRRLVRSGDDPDSKDNYGVSCLMAAFRKGHIEVVKYLVKHVKQLPPDADLSRRISRESDTELKWNCQQCMEIIVTAKQSLAAEAEKNEMELLQQLDKEQQQKENKKAAAAKKREKKEKKKVKQVKEKEEPRSDEYCPSDKPGVKESETISVQDDTDGTGIANIDSEREEVKKKGKKKKEKEKYGTLQPPQTCMNKVHQLPTLAGLGPTTPLSASLDQGPAPFSAPAVPSETGQKGIFSGNSDNEFGPVKKKRKKGKRKYGTLQPPQTCMNKVHQLPTLAGLGPTTPLSASLDQGPAPFSAPTVPSETGQKGRSLPSANSDNGFEEVKKKKKKKYGTLPLPQTCMNKLHQSQSDLNAKIEGLKQNLYTSNEINIHDFTVKGALTALDVVLPIAKGIYQQGVIVITGWGNHSKGHKSELKEAVLNHLKEKYGVEEVDGNPGCVKVKWKRKN